jgi:uncharacterized protein DUF1353
MPFLSDWVNVRSRDGESWILDEAVIYIGKYGKYVVPAGYTTDFASVPRLLWWFTPKSGPWNKAAVVHDWLITNGLLGEIDITSPRVDAEFREAMKACGVGWARRWVMWAGVRWAAVVNRVRRPGWLRTLPQLLSVTALTASPVVVPIVLLKTFL